MTLNKIQNFRGFSVFSKKRITKIGLIIHENMEIIFWSLKCLQASLKYIKLNFFLVIKFELLLILSLSLLNTEKQVKSEIPLRQIRKDETKKNSTINFSTFPLRFFFLFSWNNVKYNQRNESGEKKFENIHKKGLQHIFLCIVQERFYDIA